MSEDFVPAGSPPGWYRHPPTGIDYFYTGRSFGAVKGEFIRRPHPAGESDYIPAIEADAAAWVREHGVDSTGDPIPRHRIVTTDHLPGQRITDIMGVVTELHSASGWTASAKGNTALDNAMTALAATAASLGANAIIGLHATTFGAHGGLTSGFGGDAVGVLLIGTAVHVTPDTSNPGPHKPT